LFHYLHILSPESVSLPFRWCIPFWYLLLIRLVLSCCSPLLFPDQNPFAGSSFLLEPSPPAPCGTGSVCHWFDFHCYYEFVRRLITHRSDFPERLYLRLPLSLQLYSLTQKHVGFEFSIREDVIRPPSVTQESIRNHLDCDHPSNHYLLKLPFVHGMSHHTKATYSSLAVSSCGYRY